MGIDEIAKNLLQDKTCDNCDNGFFVKCTRPAENTCENYSRTVWSHDHEKWSDELLNAASKRSR